MERPQLPRLGPLAIAEVEKPQLVSRRLSERRGHAAIHAAGNEDDCDSHQSVTPFLQRPQQLVRLRDDSHVWCDSQGSELVGEHLLSRGRFGNQTKWRNRLED